MSADQPDSLYLDHQRPTSVPEALANHTALRRLHLWGNALASLPDWLWDVRQLERLDLRWNPLDREPRWLADMERRGCTVWR